MLHTINKTMKTTLLALLALTAISQALTIAWNKNPETNIIGYIVSYGTERGNYTVDLPVVTDNRLIVDTATLAAGNTYYFVVKAKNSQGLISLPSDVITYAYLVPPSAPTGVHIVEIETSMNLKDWETIAYVPLDPKYADKKFVRASITDITTIGK